MSGLKSFVSKVPDFYKLTPGDQIRYFAYYLQVEKGLSDIAQKDVLPLYEELNINAHTNVAQYLSFGAKRIRTQQFVKRPNGKYSLLGPLKDSIAREVDKHIEVNPSDALYPLSLFDNTRGYLMEFAKEAAACYDLGLYNSCYYMLRKMTETLIIDLFESKGITSLIQKPNKDYFQLSDLIKMVISEQTWRLSKIVRESLPNIKLLADSSVHSKRFSTKKPDIDNMKTALRIILQEFISLIDYPNWHK